MFQNSFPASHKTQFVSFMKTNKLMLYKDKVSLFSVRTIFKMYVVIPKNSGNLNRAPETVVVCPSAARCG